MKVLKRNSSSSSYDKGDQHEKDDDEAYHDSAGDNLDMYARSGGNKKKIRKDDDMIRAHHASCHRCGNMRKSYLYCKNCPQVYCNRCTQKLMEEDGKNVFDDGCPYCKHLCCCFNKTLQCKRKYHCYKKCLTTKKKVKKLEGLSSKMRMNDSYTNKAPPMNYIKAEMHTKEDPRMYMQMNASRNGIYTPPPPIAPLQKKLSSQIITKMPTQLLPTISIDSNPSPLNPLQSQLSMQLPNPLTPRLSSRLSNQFAAPLPIPPRQDSQFLSTMNSTNAYTQPVFSPFPMFPSSYSPTPAPLPSTYSTQSIPNPFSNISYKRSNSYSISPIASATSVERKEGEEYHIASLLSCGDLPLNLNGAGSTHSKEAAAIPDMALIESEVGVFDDGKP